MMKKLKQQPLDQDGLYHVECKCGRQGMLNKTEISEEDLKCYSCPSCDDNVYIHSWREVCSECGHVYPY
jgi:hypothetical protein